MTPLFTTLKRPNCEDDIRVIGFIKDGDESAYRIAGSQLSVAVRTT